MNLIKTKIFFSFFLLLTSCFFFSANCQTNEIQNNAGKKYEDLIRPQDPAKPIEISTPAEVSEPKIIIPQKDELILFLPKLDPSLYNNWNASGEPIVWVQGNLFLDFLAENQELFNELKLEKVLKQTYTKENHIVDVLIYKFNDFTGAYSAYTTLHNGITTKLKVGKNASESDKLVNFWKGVYFVDIHTNSDNDNIAKEFITLSSQDISKNIQTEQMPPVVAIQLPALNRIPGSEKYCIGSACCKKYFTENITDFNLFKLAESGGIITALYQTDDSKDKERVSLILARYTTKESAQSVFTSLKEYFDKQKSAKKEMEIDFDINNLILQIKTEKNNYTMLKQKGNLLAIAYNITSKKAGEQILTLIPWPIEITKPINTITNEDK